MAKLRPNPLNLAMEVSVHGARQTGPDPRCLQDDPKDKIGTTAGIKHDDGKARYDLLPTLPLAELVRVFTIGATKYGDRNWELGIEDGFARVYAAMQRHAWAWWGGETHDPGDGQHHLASVAWCALVLMEYERTHPELDTRVKA
jgi:hypothetical protein